MKFLIAIILILTPDLRAEDSLKTKVGLLNIGLGEGYFFHGIRVGFNNIEFGLLNAGGFGLVVLQRFGGKFVGLGLAHTLSLPNTFSGAGLYACLGWEFVIDDWIRFRWELGVLGAANGVVKAENLVGTVIHF